jgi:hypothetical protein
MPVPSPEDFLRIANDFEEQWDFPHCIGEYMSTLFALPES